MVYAFRIIRHIRTKQTLLLFLIFTSCNSFAQLPGLQIKRATGLIKVDAVMDEGIGRQLMLPGTSNNSSRLTHPMPGRKRRSA